MPVLKPPKKKRIHYKNAFGLFVGIDDEQRLPDGAESARKLYNAFLPKQQNVHLLANTEASRAIILEQLSRQLGQAQKGDLLLFYICANGLIEYDDYFFLPYGGAADDPLCTGISASLLINALSEAAQEGIKVLLILDTSYAGAVNFDLSKYGTAEEGGMACMFAASPSEAILPENQALFSRYLMEGLLGKADKLKEGVVTLRNLSDYVYTKVQESTGFVQSPLIAGTLPGEMVLKVLDRRIDERNG